MFVLGIGGVREGFGSLRSGSVEATSLSPEFGQVVVSEGYRVLLNTTKENVPFQSAGMVVPRNMLKTSPQLVENIAKATIEGVAFVHKPEIGRASCRECVYVEEVAVSGA